MLLIKSNLCFYYLAIFALPALYLKFLWIFTVYHNCLVQFDDMICSCVDLYCIFQPMQCWCDLMIFYLDILFVLCRKVEQVTEEAESLKQSLDKYFLRNQKRTMEAKERAELLGRAVCNFFFLGWCSKPAEKILFIWNLNFFYISILWNYFML